MSVFAVEMEENSHVQNALESEGFTCHWREAVLLIRCPEERWIELRRNLGTLPYVSFNHGISNHLVNVANAYQEERIQESWWASRDWFHAHLSEFGVGDCIVVCDEKLVLRTRDPEMWWNYLNNTANSDAAYAKQVTDDDF